MKKSLTAIAVAAVIAAPMAAQADMKVYGKVHTAVENIEAFGADGEWNLSGSTRKANSIGVKGATDTSLMGMKAVYKIEIGLDMENSNEYTDGSSNDISKIGGAWYQRDTWVGLSSKSMGTVRAGTIKTGYKASGQMLDPFFTTAAEGRGALDIMSGLHSGTADGRGRQTNNIQYTSPSIAGAKVVVDYNLVPGGENNMGLGVHYKNGPIAAFVDYVSHGEAYGVKDANGNAATGTATKIGGKYTMGDIAVGAQYEMDGGSLSKNEDGEANYTFLNVAYNMGATTFSLSYGMQDETESGDEDDHSGFALGAVHSIAKKTALYAAYGSLSGSDGYNAATDDDDATVMAVGLTHKF